MFLKFVVQLAKKNLVGAWRREWVVQVYTV